MWFKKSEEEWEFHLAQIARGPRQRSFDVRKQKSRDTATNELLVAVCHYCFGRRVSVCRSVGRSIGLSGFSQATTTPYVYA